MKFQQKLEANKHSEWAAYYLDYKALKKLIKQLNSPGKEPAVQVHTSLLYNDSDKTAPLLVGEVRFGSPSPERSGWSAGQGDPFVRAVEAQWDKVQSFYAEELAKADEHFRLMLPQLEQAYGSGAEGLQKSDPTGSRDPGPLSPHSERRHERSSLQRAATDVYRTLQQLRNFAIINYTGFVKIIKKHDKALPKALREQLLPRLEALPFVSGTDNEKLCQELEVAFARAFCDGNVQVARTDLLVRREAEGQSALASFGSGMRIGLGCAVLLWLLWDLAVDGELLEPRAGSDVSHIPNSIAVVAPIYRLCFIHGFAYFLWAVCLHVWKRARVNYLFMFVLVPTTALTPKEALAHGTRQLTLCLLSLIFFSKSLTGAFPLDVHPGIFPAALFIHMVGTLFYPAHRGQLMLYSLSRVLMAPFCAVSLWTSFVADVLTSMAKPFTDLAYSVCYVFSGECLLAAHHQGGCLSAAWFSLVLVPIVCGLPLYCRFMQNLRVYHDTARRIPALPNALKYAVSLVVVIFGTLRPTSILTVGWDSWLDLGWVGVYLICTLYAFSWDVCVDWRLGEGKDLLRERRMFRSTGLYYVAIAADFGLRFGWTLTLVPGGLTKVAKARGGSVMQLETFKFIIILLELVRRAMWAVLRLEAEHLHNTEGFRRVEVIPLHFDRKPAASAAAMGDSKRREQRSKIALLGELLAYIAIVGLLTFLSVLSARWSAPPLS